MECFWCPNETGAWTITEGTVDGSTFTPKGSGRTLAVDEIHPVDPTHRKNLSNITDLNNLHPAPLLDLLRRRFMGNEIYTYAVDVLISMNPYAFVAGLYDLPSDDELIRRVGREQRIDEKEEESGQVDVHDHGEPHVFSVANQAYSAMLQAQCSQSLLVSGESGAGKTEAAKYMLRYLAAVSHAAHSSSTSAAEKAMTAAASKIEASVVKSGLLLEAFGNAQTVANNNSSRSPE